MPSFVAHAIVGAALYRAVDGGRSAVVGPLVAATLAALPDVDTFWHHHVSWASACSHRGITHSLAFAIVVGTTAAVLLHRRLDFPGGFVALAAVLAAVTASHGFFDAMTDGGAGIAFFLPFVASRHFLPWRPIPVAPLGIYLTSPRTWYVIGVEALMLWPASAAVWFWRGASLGPRIALAAAVVASAVVWAIRLR